MTSEIEILKNSDLFITLEDVDLERVYQTMEKRDFHEGEKLAIAGEAARFFFFLISGTLLLSMENGKSAVMDRTGDFTGFEILSSKGIYKNTLIALTRGQAFAVNRNDFLKIIREDSSAALNIMQAWHNYRINKIPFIGQQKYSIDAYQY